MSIGYKIENFIWNRENLMTASFAVFLISVIIWAFSVFGIKYKKSRTLTPRITLFIGTFSSALLFFMSFYGLIDGSKWVAFFRAAQHALRLFVMDGGEMDWTGTEDFENLGFGTNMTDFDELFCTALYLLAPILTFSFIPFFFRNLLNVLRYKFFVISRTHVFSDLNEKSLAMANDIVNTRRDNGVFKCIRKICKNGSVKELSRAISNVFIKDIIVFTDIIEKKEENNIELVEGAKEIKAILFRKDLESIKFRTRLSTRKVIFYLLSDDESEKIRHAESIMKKYDYKNVELYVFSDDTRTELFLAAKELKRMKMARVNDIQALIYHNLFKNGHYLFKRARKDIDGENVISVVIVGLGRYGKEMLKALTWYCQLDKYKIKINAFDTDEKAREKMEVLCPDLLSSKYNKVREKQEAYYEIEIHQGIDVSVPAFEEKLKEINDATFIFVCLGDDATNLEVSARIRSICERIRYTDNDRKPDIETVIYDSKVHNNMGITWETIMGDVNAPEGIKNAKGKRYNILMTGDLENFYCQKTLINSELIKLGKNEHTSYSTNSVKIEFATECMEKEWKAFLQSKKLLEAWDACVKKEQVSFSELAIMFLADKQQEQAKRSFRVRNQVPDMAEYREQWNGEALSKFEELMQKTDIKEKYNKEISLDKAENLENKISFATQYMEKEWNQFIEKNKLMKLWLKHKKENELTFAKLIGKFNYLTKEEEEKAGEDKKAQINLRIKKKDEWEKLVLAKFEELKEKDRGFTRKWKVKKKRIDAEVDKEFMYDYNYRSSITKAIHKNLLKSDNGIGSQEIKTAVKLTLKDMSFEQKMLVGTVEHARWNAYMRSEGFTFSPERNDLAKQHPNLVPLDQLTHEDIRNDV